MNVTALWNAPIRQQINVRRRAPIGEWPEGGAARHAGAIRESGGEDFLGVERLCGGNAFFGLGKLRNRYSSKPLDLLTER